MKEIERVDGVPGEKIDLTIDARLQEKAYDLFGEESGAVILLDVRTGEILSFVSTPAYDPNLMSQGMPTKIWNIMQNNERRPLSNKAISGQYSPGSTFKMIVALAGMEAQSVKKDTKHFCSGKLMLGSHTFHCWKKHGHGYMDVVQAIQHSCDVFFYETAQRIGVDKIAEVARKFGLGKKVDIGLGYELSGLIPTRDWKKKYRNESWQKGDNFNAGIGQGYVLSTPIQLASMIAKLVNGGYDIKPTFTKPTQAELNSIKKINVRDEHLTKIKDGMYSVVNVPGGTAFMSRFNYNGIKMGGKTGTTQVRRITLKERQTGVLKGEALPWKLRNHALFVGYAPHDNPKYAIAVLVEHGGGGSSVAAPIGSKILLEAIKLDDMKE